MHKSVYLLSIGMFALGLDAYVVAGLLPGIANTYGVSVASAGMTVAVFTVFYALSAPVFATLLAGHPARSILCIALAVFTIANIGSALAPSFSWLLMSRAVAGAGAGVYLPLAAASAATLVGKERQGRVLGFILGGMSLGTVVGVPAGLMVAAHIGWQGTLWIVAGIGALALAGVLTFFPAVSAASPPSLAQRLAMMRDRDVVRIVSITALISIASLGLYTYVTPMLAEAGASAYLPLLLCVWGAGGIIGSFSIGRVIDGTRKKAQLIGYIAIGLFCVFATLPIALSHGLLAIIAFFLWGLLGWASQAPQQHSLLAAHPDHGPAAVALNSSANYLGSAAGAFLGSMLIELGVHPHYLPLAAALIVLVAISIHISTKGIRGKLQASSGECGS